MSDVRTKQELRDATRASREALLNAMAGLTDEDLAAPGVTGDWSIKDSLAHISAWERMFIGWIDALMAGRRPDRPADATQEWVNETNARIFDEHRGRGLDAVRQESQASHDALLALIDRLSEDELFDPQHFGWARGNALAPWLRGNADQHYGEHREAIGQWRAGRGGGGA
jgi:hypothetical protein